jgi:hypothetical protein
MDTRQGSMRDFAKPRKKYLHRDHTALSSIPHLIVITTPTPEATMSTEPTLPEFPPAWRAVSLGTKCFSFGAWSLLVGATFLPVFAIVQHQLLSEHYAAQEIRGRGIPFGPLLIAFFIFLIGLLAWLTGLSLCALAPVESGVRTFAISAIACWTLFVIVGSQTSLLTGIGFAPLYTRETVERREPPIRVVAVNEIGFGSAAVLLAVAASVLTSCALCAIAHHYRNAVLAQRGTRLIVYQFASVAMLVLLGFLYLYGAATWRRAGIWLWGPLVATALVIVSLGCFRLLRVLKDIRAMLAIAEENARPLETPTEK